MNNEQFIAALKKALSGLDRQSQKDIVEEIKSHAVESGDSLSERFGSPQDLAQQYLEGEIVAKPWVEKIWGISKKLLLAIGALVAVLVVLAAIVMWWFTRDAFDYADESATELNKNQAAWQSVPWSTDLNIQFEQASAVVYWHDEMTLRSNCQSEKSLRVEGELIKVYRDKYIFYLPKVSTNIKAKQSELVVVRPQVSLNLDIDQAELRIAANGEQYNFVIEASRTKIADLPSHSDAAHTISIKSMEATISAYSY